MSNVTNQEGITQEIEQNQPEGKVADNNLSEEQLAAQRSMARDEFFSSISEEEILKKIDDVSFNNGSFDESSTDTQKESNPEQKEGDSNGLQGQMRRKEEEVDNTSEDKPSVKLGEVQQTNEADEQNKEVQTESQPQQEEQPKVKYKIKANGEEWEYELDEIKMLASKGINYTKKLQALSPYRKMINAVSENGITEDDINQLIEMKKGNKDAIGAFTKKYNIALSDIEAGEANAQNYKPQSYGREYSELQEVDAEIRSMIPSGTYLNQSQYDSMVNFFNNTLTNADRELFEQNPQALHLLANDFKTGIFNAVVKEVERLDNIEYYKRGVRFIDKYIDVNNKLNANILKSNSTQQAVDSQQAPQQSNVDKSKLGLTGTSSVAQKSAQAQVMEDLTDEDFEKFFKDKTGMDFSSYVH